MKKLKDNKMGTMPIPKLMLTMSLPAILSMMVQAMYNVVDSIFVSKLGEEALTAVSLAFPIQLIIIACFLGIGTGVNSLISRKIGEKDLDSATNAAEHGFILSGVLYIIIVTIGIFLANNFFVMFTDDSKILGFGTDYIRIIMFFSFGRMFAQAGMSTLQGTGEMVKPMIAQLIGALLNIVLDPILIFGLLGFPAMGVSGAAIATVAAQIVSMIYILVVLFRKDNYIKLNLKKFKYSSSIIKQILIVGLPVAVMQGLASIMLTGLNLVLASFNETAVAVMGVYFKLQSFVFMPIFGLSQGTMPIIGYNFGARDKDRLMSALKIGISSAVLLTTIGLIVFQLFPVKLLSLFNSTYEMTEIGVVAFRIISLGFPMAAVSIMLSVSFQGMGDAYISLIVSFIRQIIVLLPTAYIFGKLAGLNAVWFGFVISEAVASLGYCISLESHIEQRYWYGQTLLRRLLYNRVKEGLDMGKSKEVYKVLGELKIPYKVYSHPAVYTSEEAEKYVDASMEGSKCKNLFLRNQKGDRHFIVIIDHSKRVDLKELSKNLEEKRISFASENRLDKYLGLLPGSVSPFGLINDENREVIVVIDAELKKEEKINFHPNINTETLTVLFKDFERFLDWVGNKRVYLKV